MKRIMSIALVTSIILINTLGVFATTKTVGIPRLGYGECKLSATRTGRYSYVQAGCNAVYPQGDYTTDNFTKIRVKIRSSADAIISSEKVLTEGQAVTNISINEGYLDKTNIYFCFYGNSSTYPATAQVEYYAK